VGLVLAGFIEEGAQKMKPLAKAYALYFPEDKPLAPGTTLRNPELAESLRRIAREGRRGFYEGPTADALIATLNAGKHPATLADLAAFQPQWKRPLCTDYRGRTILSAPPPQTGLQVLHTLELLEPFDLKALGLPTRSPAAFDVLVSALRVGQTASRGNADPNWVAVPANGLSSAAFAAERKTSSAPAPPRGDRASRRAAVRSGLAARVHPHDRRPAPAVPGRRGCRRLRGLGERIGETQGDHLRSSTRTTPWPSRRQKRVWGSGGFVAGFFEARLPVCRRDHRRTVEAAGAFRTTTIAPAMCQRGIGWSWAPGGAHSTGSCGDGLHARPEWTRSMPSRSAHLPDAAEPARSAGARIPARVVA
jgi:hypothetical protein